MTDRQHWPSTWIFILAAIGSAAGLGNLWRFPFLAFEHGGAAFVLALLFANVIIGIPLLIGEVGLGQLTQRAAPDAFARIKPKLKYLGWAAIFLGFLVVTYYVSIISWGVNYLAASFTLEWGEDAKSFFFGNVLNLSESVDTVGNISWPLFTGLAIAWVLIYFSVWKGIKSISRVVKWTATLPFVILAILIVRAVTLPGASEGLKLFLIPEWSALLDHQLWIAAFSQVFFSLSLAFGIMVAYGSFQPHNADVTKSAIYITAGNFLVSLMSGIVVFGTLGYMALQNGVAVTEVVAGGPALAFIVFPTAISLLPAFNTFIAVLFFGMLLLLAIDSAFSLLEAFTAAFRDRYPSVSTEKINLLISIVGFAAGIIFTTGAGLYYLDILDHFIVSYGLIIVGFLEAIVIGWVWKGNKLIDFINENSSIKIGQSWLFSLRFVMPIFLLILLVLNIYTEFTTPYEGYPTAALVYIGALPILLTPVIGYLIDKLTTKSA